MSLVFCVDQTDLKMSNEEEAFKPNGELHNADTNAAAATLTVKCEEIKEEILEFQEDKYNIVPPKQLKKLRMEDSLCPLCGKCYAGKFSLNIHINTVHSGVKRFKCDECTKCFGQNGSLKLHKRSVHEKAKDFICPMCSKGFTIKQTLQFHIKTVHDNIRDYECKECHKMFGLPRQLYVHFKLVHEKIKDKVCTVCGKAFGCTSTFSKHMKSVHENYKDPRAKCHICSLQLTRISSHVRHLRNVHKITNP